ncbi:hypothetical protein SLEP1_g59394 [Rubroshorea leprosula]|uniref:Uncharacterized protein n=1 Tax=Rubroshorea leprosula TaxID=152421 RepID=A0AAV5MUN8_9ROSI|nr:hypothetical protein SLEP1_g59394 [Rubroshorea leprosula]
MDQFIQQDPFGSDQGEWDWSDLSLGWLTPAADRCPMPRFAKPWLVERTRRLVPSKRLDGDGSNQAKPKAFVGTRDAKDRRLLGYGAACWTTSEELIRLPCILMFQPSSGGRPKDVITPKEARARPN